MSNEEKVLKEKINMIRACYVELLNCFAHATHLMELYSNLNSPNYKEAKFYSDLCYQQTVKNYKNELGQFNRLNEKTPVVKDCALVFLIEALKLKNEYKKGYNKGDKLNKKNLRNHARIIEKKDIDYHLNHFAIACIEFMSNYTKFREKGYVLLDSQIMDNRYYNGRIQFFVHILNRVEATINKRKIDSNNESKN